MSNTKRRNRRQHSLLNKARRRKSRGNELGCHAYASLEPRLALTTFVVSTVADDIDGTVAGLSLREAVIAANTNAAFGQAAAGTADGDVIQFDSALSGMTLTLTGGQLTITEDLLIQGGGLGITVDGGGSNRIFQISTNEVVGFGGLTFTGGNATIGGAISSTGGGNTIVRNSTFTNNVATGLGGGAIYHEVGNFYISNSNFTDNVANGASGSGGAILSASGVTAISGGKMESNIANRAGGAIEVIAGELYTVNVTVGGAEGKGNVAGPMGSASPGNGGGLHVTGAATVSISGGQFTGNWAAREGGGIWNQAGTDMYIRAGAMVTNNIAAGNAADDGGGGVFNNGGSVFFNGATIAANGASGSSGSGGGIFSTAGRVIVVASTLDGNAAARAGGGIEVIDGTVSLINSIVSNNDVGITYTAAPGNGGGLHVTGAATVLVDDGMFDGNQAASEGGGLWNQAGSSMFIRNGAEISNNQAAGADADNGGGGVFNNGGFVHITDTMVSNNQANGAAGSGGGIFSTAGSVLIFDSVLDGNAAARAGGGVEVIDGNVRFTNSTVSNNDAGVTVTAAPGNGGGLHTSGVANVVVNGGEFSNNLAFNQGGGLWNQTGANLFIENGAMIRNNTTTSALSVGGGVYTKGYLRTLDSVFSMNGAVELGGGILVTSTGRARVVNANFIGNTAGTRGGGIYNFGFMTVRDSAFTSNITSLAGGAFFTHGDATTVRSGNSFTGNAPNDTN